MNHEQAVARMRAQAEAWRKYSNKMVADDYAYVADMADQAKALQERAAMLEEVVRGIAQAKRFDRDVFQDDTSFVDWARSICAHAIAAKRTAGEKR